MLKNARKSKKLSQQALATKINVKRCYISRLENHPNTCNPSVKLVVKLSKELDCSPVELFLFFIDVDFKIFNKND